MNIGVYSKKKNFYSENLEDQIKTLGFGVRDLYLILEGDEKD